MKALSLLVALLVVGLAVGMMFWPDPEKESTPETPEQTERYQTGNGTPDGIGKFYMGREIAKVMGHPAIVWLERPEREREEAPKTAIELIDLEPNQVLADIGAGSGYYSLRLAMKQPEAEIVAVDIQQEMIDFLEGRKTNLEIDNLSTHLGKIDDIGLEPESIDAALMVDAYHEFSHPYEMMTSIVTALRPGGRVYLLEFREEDPMVNIKPLHKMSQAQSIKEMTAVGLKHVKTLDQLPQQHFMIFEKP